MSNSTDNIIEITVRSCAAGRTYFLDYDWNYNPWRIWAEHLQNAVQSDLKRLESEDERRMLGSFHDEKYFYRKIHNRMYGALLLTIYSEVENCLKRILNIEDYKFECLKCKLKQVNIKCENLPHYREVNILRLKANAFKHNDMIMTKELTKVLKEKEPKLIDYTRTDIGELVIQCAKFLDALEKGLKDGNSAK